MRTHPSRSTCSERAPVSSPQVQLDPERQRRSSRALYVWGRNNAGQLGLGHTEDVPIPTTVSSFEAKQVTMIAAGGDASDPEYGGFSIALTSSGVLMACGCNSRGQLGVGDTVDRHALVPVLALDSQASPPVAVRQVLAGRGFALVLTEDGRVYTWGSNTAGELGQGDMQRSLRPQLVAGLLDGVAVEAVAVGAQHVLALARGGALYSWGSNARGQLGVGLHVPSSAEPMLVQGSVTGIRFAHVAAGAEHSLACAKSGELYAWGSNQWGQLGLGDLENRPTPNAILHQFSKSRVVRISGGGRHTMAATADGDIFTWGANDCGQLGYDTPSERPYVALPKRLEALRSQRIKAGPSSSLAYIGSGKLFVMGCSARGELGFGDTTRHVQPKLVTPPGTGLQLQTVSIGATHTLAANGKGELFGWGGNDRGQLGVAFTSETEWKAKLMASAVPVEITYVATGGFGYEYEGHTFALTGNRKLYAWGWNAFGQLGVGALSTGTATPSRLFALETPHVVRALAAGQHNTVAITDRRDNKGAVFTWGPNYDGQLGHKFMELGPELHPSRVEFLRDKQMRQVAHGYNHVLALDEDGTVYAWGNNYHGQLGLGDSKDRTKPVAITTFGGTRVVHIAATMQSSFAITAAGSVYGWGYNQQLELGLGDGIDRNSPQMIATLNGLNVTSIAGGGYHCIARTGSGDLYAWGNNYYGQLGLGHHNPVQIPHKVELPMIAIPPKKSASSPIMDVIAAGTWHSVAATGSGDVYAWGRGSFGQLGLDQDLVPNEGLPSPTQVDALQGVSVKGLAAAAAHTIAIGVSIDNE
eukprot:scaffold2033_cov367-Prasinococcus_capsulatus_cf.AAC.7